MSSLARAPERQPGKPPTAALPSSGLAARARCAYMLQIRGVDQHRLHKPPASASRPGTEHLAAIGGTAPEPPSRSSFSARRATQIDQRPVGGVIALAHSGRRSASPSKPMPICRGAANRAPSARRETDTVITRLSGVLAWKAASCTFHGASISQIQINSSTSASRPAGRDGMDAPMATWSRQQPSPASAGDQGIASGQAQLAQPLGMPRHQLGLPV